MKNSSHYIYDTDDIIGRLKQVLNVRSDAKLAEMLGIAPNTIATWKRRGYIDVDLIVAHCDFLDIYWVLYGTGDIYSSNPSGVKRMIEDISREIQPRDMTFKQISFVRELVSAAEEITEDALSMGTAKVTWIFRHPLVPAELFADDETRGKLEYIVLYYSALKLAKALDEAYMEFLTHGSDPSKRMKVMELRSGTTEIVGSDDRKCQEQISDLKSKLDFAEQIIIKLKSQQ